MASPHDVRTRIHGSFTTSRYLAAIVSSKAERAPRLPPRWFIHVAWRVHRAIYRFSRGRRGLWAPTSRRWGALRLTCTGRRSGKARSVVLAYFEDDADLVTIAMNGWGRPEPAWWLNLQSYPNAAVDLVAGPRAVRARAAKGEERRRLWARWRQLLYQLDEHATLRPTETAVVILEPR